MYKLAIFLIFALTRTVHSIGDRTLSVIISETSVTQWALTFSIAVAANNLLVIGASNGKPEENIENFLERMLYSIITYYMQQKGWMEYITKRFGAVRFIVCRYLTTLENLDRCWMIMNITKMHLFKNRWRKIMQASKLHLHTMLLHCSHVMPA